MAKANVDFGEAVIHSSVKDKQEFKFFNNSLVYVTFRADTLEDMNLQSLAKMMLKQVNPVLMERSKKYNGTLKVSIHKLFKTYVILSMSEDYAKIKNCHKKVAKILSEFTVDASEVD